MATKAEAFKAQQMLATHGTQPPKAKKAPRNPKLDTSLPGVSASDKRVGAGSSSRNESARVAKRGGPALEESATGKPSRKSTRKSSGRVKRSTNQQEKAVRATSAPKSQAAKAQAKKK
jgi:hypothetical protein